MCREFIEYAEVHGNLYGTLREPMNEALAKGFVYLVEIDVQGANQLKQQGIPGIYTFIAPPSFEVLRQRLEGRGTDAPDVIERRLRKAHDEYEERDKYDHVIVNHTVDSTVRSVRVLAGLDAQSESAAGSVTPPNPADKAQ